MQRYTKFLSIGIDLYECTEAKCAFHGNEYGLILEY